MDVPENDKKKDVYQKDGKGIYVGESSRSMYLMAKEHQKDRDDKAEESHQVKHWLLDHPELREQTQVQV